MKVLCAFPYSDAEKLCDILDTGNHEVAWLPKESFSIMERKRTPMELSALKTEWESTPHLMSGAGYIEKIKDDLIKVHNHAYPENLVRYVLEIHARAKLIIVPFDKRVLDELAECEVPYMLVYPANTYANKAEWVGRAYLQGATEPQIKELVHYWDKWIHDCENNKTAASKFQMGAEGSLIGESELNYLKHYLKIM